jgi:hypothetical protein
MINVNDKITENNTALYTGPLSIRTEHTLNDVASTIFEGIISVPLFTLEKISSTV